MKTQLEFIDAQAMSKKYPATFEAPSKEELYALEEGDIVKVCCADERFWTIIEKVDGEKIHAIVDNELMYTEVHGLRLEDKIEFEKRHIYSVFKT